MRLQGKVAIVTGAGAGIGRAVARRFAAEGARVVAADVDGAAVEETCAGGEIVPVTADVTSDADIARVVATARERFGGVDVFHNNAGIAAHTKPFSEISRAEWDRTIAVNLTACFVAAHAVVPALRERGGGSILVTASIIARRPRPGLAAYTASKAGVTGLARALAIELAPDRIRVNVINPGPANTQMLDVLGFDQSVGEALPLGRLIEPDDIAGAAVYLASDEAEAVTGAVFNIDGGRDL